MLANSIGLVDQDYRGPILVRFKVVGHNWQSPFPPLKKYAKGDRIAQLVVRKTIRADFVEVQELSTTERSVGGFGSSGR